MSPVPESRVSKRYRTLMFTATSFSIRKSTSLHDRCVDEENALINTKEGDLT